MPPFSCHLKSGTGFDWYHHVSFFFFFFFFFFLLAFLSFDRVFLRKRFEVSCTRSLSLSHLGHKAREIQFNCVLHFFFFARTSLAQQNTRQHLQTFQPGRDNVESGKAMDAEVRWLLSSELPVCVDALSRVVSALEASVEQALGFRGNATAASHDEYIPDPVAAAADSADEAAAEGPGADTASESETGSSANVNGRRKRRTLFWFSVVFIFFFFLIPHVHAMIT